MRRRKAFTAITRVLFVLADMEGPAVKWFVTAPSISWSMLTSGISRVGMDDFPRTPARG